MAIQRTLGKTMRILTRKLPGSPWQIELTKMIEIFFYYFCPNQDYAYKTLPGVLPILDQTIHFQPTFRYVY